MPEFVERRPAPTLSLVIVDPNRLTDDVDLTDELPRRVAGGEGQAVWLSAKTGAGIDLLQDAILDSAGAHEDMEGTFLARERHLHALGSANEHLAVAAAHLASAVPPLELFAEELREAQGALSTISGKFTADDLLGEIFSRFCIGK